MYTTLLNTSTVWWAYNAQQQKWKAVHTQHDTVLDLL